MLSGEGARNWRHRDSRTEEGVLLQQAMALERLPHHRLHLTRRTRFRQSKIRGHFAVFVRADEDRYTGRRELPNAAQERGSARREAVVHPDDDIDLDPSELCQRLRITGCEKHRRFGQRSRDALMPTLVSSDEKEGDHVWLNAPDRCDARND